ncbi:hypothetical protein CLU79DRAFT_775601 [Phycomyces nitens]|nr:hypothetical protein CLU79DRAFT_775601 [Phycomyces nitens]
MSSPPNSSELVIDSFSVSERHKGLHLLIDSRTDVQVQAEQVPTETTHLYPKLAGFNWTCYITTESAVLGRSRTDQDKQTPRVGEVYIGLGSSKAISRRHAEIKYNPRRKRWEIRVAGRNSIKVGHLVKKRGDPPIGLSTGSLLDIGGVQSVFILPDGYSGPPQEVLPNTQSTAHGSEAATPSSENDSVQHVDDDGALGQILNLLQRSTPNRRSTKEIVEFVYQHAKDSDKSEFNKEIILSMLVRSPHFYLTDFSHTASQPKSDEAQWTWDVQEDPGESHISQDIYEDFEFNSIGSPGYISQSPRDPDSAETPWLGSEPLLGISIADVYSTWLISNNNNNNNNHHLNINSNCNDINSLDRDGSPTDPTSMSELPFKRIRTETDAEDYQGIRNVNPWKAMRQTVLFQQQQ